MREDGPGPGECLRPPRERRLACADVPVRLLALDHAAGDHPAPATPDAFLTLVTRGTYRARVSFAGGRRSRLFRPGDMVLVPHGTGCDCVVDGPHSLLVVSFPFERARPYVERATGRPASDFGAAHAGVFRDPFVSQLCRRMWDEAAEGGPRGALFGEAAFQAMIAALVGRAGPDGRTRAGPPLSRVRRALDRIEAGLDRDLSLDALAAEAGMSVFGFSRAFSRATGLPPHRYVLGRRIERAKALLRGTDLPVIDVALRCGFSSPQYFATAFRRATGMAPRSYRRAG